MKLTLKQWMALKGYSIKKLSKESGVSEATISHFRTGKYKPRLDTLITIAKALSISIEDIEV